MKLSDWLHIVVRESETCSFCGAQATRGAVWNAGEAQAVVCVPCLYTNAIPALVADALADSGVRPDAIEGIRRGMDADFWRALYLAATRIAPEDRQHDDHP